MATEAFPALSSTVAPAPSALWSANLTAPWQNFVLGQGGNPKLVAPYMVQSVEGRIAWGLPGLPPHQLSAYDDLSATLSFRQPSSTPSDPAALEVPLVRGSPFFTLIFPLGGPPATPMLTTIHAITGVEASSDSSKYRVALNNGQVSPPNQPPHPILVSRSPIVPAIFSTCLSQTSYIRIPPLTVCINHHLSSPLLPSPFTVSLSTTARSAPRSSGTSPIPSFFKHVPTSHSLIVPPISPLHLLAFSTHHPPLPPLSPLHPSFNPTRHGQTWLVYLSSPLAMRQDGATLVADAPFTGTMRVALLPGSSPQDEEALLGAHVPTVPRRAATCVAMCAATCVAMCAATCVAMCAATCVAMCAATCVAMCAATCVAMCAATCVAMCAATCVAMCAATCVAMCAATCVAMCAATCVAMCAATCVAMCAATCVAMCAATCVAMCAATCVAMCAATCVAMCAATCVAMCVATCVAMCAATCVAMCAATCVAMCAATCVAMCAACTGAWMEVSAHSPSLPSNLRSHTSGSPSGALGAIHGHQNPASATPSHARSNAPWSSVRAASVPDASVLAYPTIDGQVVGMQGGVWRLNVPKLPSTWRPGPLTSDPQLLDELRATLKQDVASLPPLFSTSTYSFGKAAGRAARLALIAKQVQDEDSLAAVLPPLRTALSAWLDGTFPGNRLLYGPTWGGMVSEAGSRDQGVDFRAAMYNDHHFHYGYFIYAAATVAKFDPAWRDWYRAPLEDLMADYMLAERTAAFPRLRHFDAYALHSWASGLFEFGNGRNQESFSEAANAYYVGALLASVLSDQPLASLGATLASVEALAGQTLMHVPLGSSDPEPSFTPASEAVFADANRVVGVLWSTKRDAALWFALPADVGIQVLLVSPFLKHLFPDPEFAKQLVEWAQPVLSGAATDEWRGFVWALQALYDPQGARANIAALGAFDDGNSKTNMLWWLASNMP
ncbi:unnamed protein product [Closterium sp. Naga37s-1]|nr:unnamed protein product [Closterium sp. Naga37s-1]